MKDPCVGAVALRNGPGYGIELPTQARLEPRRRGGVVENPHLRRPHPSIVHPYPASVLTVPSTKQDKDPFVTLAQLAESSRDVRSALQ